MVRAVEALSDWDGGPIRQSYTANSEKFVNRDNGNFRDQA